MTVKEAYNIAISNTSNKKLVECLDFGEFFGFYFIPENRNPEEVIGGAYLTVNKTTEEISYFIPFEDFGLFSKAKKVMIDGVIK